MLSVIILTKNEEDRIRVCLESVKWADEIIVVDNGSNDKTLQIVKEYTDKILQFHDQDFSKLRNSAMEASLGEWVLYVDSDERILDHLREEIEAIIHDSPYSAYAISRKNIIFGKEVNYGPFWPDWVIRLLKKKDFESWVGKIHEYPRFKGKLGYTKNSLLHLTHRDLEHIVLKSLEWSKIDAQLRLNAHHPKMSGLRFIRVLFSELFNQLIIRKGFNGGTTGVMDATLQAFSTFMSYIRLWQMQQPRLLGDIYDGIDKKLVENNFKYS